MTIIWNQYEPYVPPYRGPQAQLSSSEARESFDQLMAAKPRRTEQLRTLLEANGLTLNDDDAFIRRLNHWFRENVEANPDEPGRLRNLWYAVVNDVALFLGDVLIARCPNLHWDLVLDGRRDIPFQKHVIVGFGNVPNPKFNLDIDRLVATYAHQVVAGDSVDADFFAKVLASAAAKA